MGRERPAGAVVALWLIVLAKLVAAVGALVFAFLGAHRRPTQVRARRFRALGWLVSLGLVLYGGALTIAGLLIDVGVIQAADDADERALTWHTYVWDPWFALWGAAFAVVMWRTRPAKIPAEPVRRTSQSACSPPRCGAT